MSGKDKRHVFKLPQGSGHLADQWSAVATDYMNRVSKCLDEYQEQVTSINDESMEKYRSIWWQMAAALGIDPETTWNNPEWSLDFQYYEMYGDVYITWNPSASGGSTVSPKSETIH